MLVLTRKTDQTITIDGTTITVLLCKNGRVRLGIDAPKDVKILRGELPELKDPCDASTSRGTAK